MIGYIGYIEDGAVVREERVEAFDTSAVSPWHELPFSGVWNCPVYASPYQSWVLNKWRGMWEPPVQMPQDGKNYSWDEPTTTWVELPALGA
jgi:hypothetical protein